MRRDPVNSTPALSAAVKSSAEPVQGAMKLVHEIISSLIHNSCPCSQLLGATSPGSKQVGTASRSAWYG